MKFDVGVYARTQEVSFVTHAHLGQQGAGCGIEGTGNACDFSREGPLRELAHCDLGREAGRNHSNESLRYIDEDSQAICLCHSEERLIIGAASSRDERSTIDVAHGDDPGKWRANFLK